MSNLTTQVPKEPLFARALNEPSGLEDTPNGWFCILPAFRAYISGAWWVSGRSTIQSAACLGSFPISFGDVAVAL